MSRRLGKADGDYDDHDEDDEEDVHFAVRLARADPESRSYDPRYARPIESASMSGSMAGWGEFDPAILDDGRPAVPAFPLDVLPTFWRAWARDTAQAAGAPVDYVALSLIAAVAGLCGVGVRVQPSPGWQEPLVLWQVLVGAASSGKSPAIASLRGLLATLARERAGAAADPDATSGSAPTAAETPLMGLADAATSDARGALLWCDEPADWLARLGSASSAARTQLVRAWSPPLAASTADTERLAVSLLACLSPDRVPQMAKIGVELAARVLFTWPHPPPYSPLAGRKAANDGEALAALRRLLSLAGTAAAAGSAAAPRLLRLDDKALAPLDSFLARLHDELAEAEGLDQAWQGKGRGTVVRLIGCLALLDASVDGVTPDVIKSTAVERAVALWRDYLRPHARAVLQGGLPDALEDKARHVVRWLRARGVSSFSREEIRCEALRRSLDAARTDQILSRLSTAGIVKRVHYSEPRHGGRPPNRWEVNPRLVASGNLSAGNAGNSGNPENAAGTASAG